jgi:PmbA protein
MNNLENQLNLKELASWTVDQAKKAGAENCRVRISKRKFVEINYRERKPEVIKEAITQGLYLEVFTNNRFAGKSTPDFRKTTLPGFINDLVESAKIMEEDSFRTLPDAKYYLGQSTSDLQLADPSQAKFTPDERHSMVKSMEDSCLKKGGDKVISVEAGEYDDSNEEYVLSSNGFEATTKTTEYWTGASMTARDEGDRKPEGYHWVGCRHRSDLPSLQQVGEEAAKRTLDLMGGKKIPTETLPIIIENRNAARAIYALIDAMNARNIQQKRSFLSDKKGQTIASKILTLRDDPFIPRGLGSRYYDGDGFPTRKRELITNGVLNDFLVDWYYSRKLDWQPNSGSTTNLIIPPGTKSVDTIIKELGRCMLITDFMGGNSNPTTGDFSIGVIGKLYDKGQFVQNVAEMNIADNHLRFWNKLIEVGNDPWLYSSARLPSLVFDKVIVAGI